MSPLISALVFGLIYFGIGIGALVYMTKGTCSKQDLGKTSMDSAVIAVFMTGVYLLMPYMTFLTNPVKATFEALFTMVGLESYVQNATWLAEAYLLIMFSWVSVFWIGMRLQREVCKPTDKERDKFKTDLLKKLHNLQPAKLGRLS